MEKKRKFESEPSLPTLRAEEEERIIAGEEDEEEEDPEELIELEEDEEIEYEEVEEEVEEEGEEEEEEEEEDTLQNDGDVVEEPILSNNVGGGAADASPTQSNNDGGHAEEPIQSNNDGDGVEKKPIQSVLAELSREKLVELLSEAAAHHADVAARVRASAYVDPSLRKIFVHGLKWDTTSEDLLPVFAKYGEIEDCRVIAERATGKSKGYGFVLFKDCGAAQHALKEPQKSINGRMTCSQLASLGPIATEKPQQQPDCTPRKIYVSNAGAELDPEKVKDFFSKYGEIEEGPLGLDRETGKLKGFCLFTYKTAESAKSALVEPHKQFQGVTLYCRQAIDGPKPHKNASKSLKYVEDMASGEVALPMVPPTYLQPPPPMNMDPFAVGQALNLLGALTAMGAATGLLNNSAMVPGYGGPIVQGGYGGGMNMGSNGMDVSWNQGGSPNQMRWQGQGRGRGRGRGRGFHGPRPRMDQ